MSDPDHDLQRRCDRLGRRLARERSARAQAESIAERAIRDLANANKVYERFFELNLELLCTADDTLHFRELNPAWETVLGWTLDELRAHPFLHFVHPDDLERTEREAARLLEDTGTTVGFLNRYRHRDGHWVWLSWSARLSAGTFYAAATDVSSRVRAEETLAESEARMRAILDSAVDAILTIDHEGIIVDLNPATETLFGYGKEELVGRNVSALMPSPYSEHHDRYLRRYLDTRSPRVIGSGREAEAQRKDGTVFPIYLAVGEVRDTGRQLFTGIITDITERNAARQRLEETLADLQRSRDDLLATLNQLRIGAMMIDETGHVTFVNQVEAGSCWSSDQPVVGRRWDEVLPFDTSSRDALRRLMRTEQSARNRLTCKWPDAAGGSHWSEVEVRDDPRKRSSRIAFFYDVSELHRLRARAAAASYGQMIGNSAAMRGVYDRIAEVAKGDWTVLVEGETGSGKELVARAIHAASKRRNGPFIAVNCAGLADSLLESQLFGHRRGAFTGAVSDQQGFFEAAAGGTILLDEIGDVSMKLQNALLRVIQEREVVRIGDSVARKIDVRILAATNRDLAAEVTAGRFRQDLLYRIRVARIAVPPLRDRVEDIPLLLASFLAEQRLVSGKPIQRIDGAAVDSLREYPWPGNIRELKAAIEFAAISCKTNEILVGDLPPEIRHLEPCLPQTEPTPAAPAPPRPRSPARAEAADPELDERQRILLALEWAEGNRARAARRLGISRATLYRRMRALEVPVKRVASE